MKKITAMVRLNLEALAYSQEQLWDLPALAFSVLFYTSFTVKTCFLVFSLFSVISWIFFSPFLVFLKFLKFLIKMLFYHFPVPFPPLPPPKPPSLSNSWHHFFIAVTYSYTYLSINVYRHLHICNDFTANHLVLDKSGSSCLGQADVPLPGISCLRLFVMSLSGTGKLYPWVDFF